MSEERDQVLAMVAQNKLTVEQAQQLLDVIEARALQSRPQAQGYAPVAARAPMAPIPPVPPRAPVPPVPPVPPRAPRAPRAPLRRAPRFDDLIQLAIHDISPEYVKALRDAGLDDLTMDDVVQLGIHEISPEYVKSLREAGLTDLKTDDVVQMGIHNVKPETVKMYMEAGLDWERRPRALEEDDDCDCDQPATTIKRVRKELQKVGSELSMLADGDDGDDVDEDEG